MSINIIDNFSVNVAKPIDAKIVASGSVARNAIAYKYDGLKVFDTSDRVVYTWNINSSSWEIENINLIDGYVPKKTTYGFTNSIIFSTASYVGVNVNDPKGVLQINSTSPDITQPTYLIKSGGFSYLSSNWYLNGFSDDYKDSTKGSARVVFIDSDGSLKIDNRDPNGVFRTTLKSVNLGTQSYIYLNDTNLQFRNDSYHGLSWKNSFGGYDSAIIDGPVLYGLNGGALGSRNFSGERLALHWDNNGVSTFAGPVRLINGTNILPALSFSSSTNTGIYSPSVGQLAISANGVTMSRFTNIDFFANVHDTGGGTANHFSPSISSGGYTPSVSGVSNCTVTINNQSYWSRVGNVITVSGRVVVDPVAVGASSFRLTIPISYYYLFGINSFIPMGGWVDVTWRLNGVGQFKHTTAMGDTCSIEAQSVGDLPYALFSFYATQTVSKTLHFTYQYVLGPPPEAAPFVPIDPGA